MKISILGAGNMGTALSVVLSEKKENNITFWSIEEDVNNSINNQHENFKYLKGVKLRNDIKATSNIKTALQDAELVIFSVPSQVIRKVCEQCKDLIPKNTIILSTSKGLEKETNKRMSEVISEYFNNALIVLGGPCIANEFSKKIPTYAIIASKNNNTIKTCKNVLETNYFNISTSNDVLGVEICSVLKNIIAIMAGISDGLGYGINTKSGIITKGLSDLKKISLKLGAKKETIYGLAGLGDLIVTCSSKHSRNRRFGESLGKGESGKTINQVVEGSKSVIIIKKIIENNKLDCPIIQKVYNIVIKGEKPNV